MPLAWAGRTPGCDRRAPAWPRRGEHGEFPGRRDQALWASFPANAGSPVRVLGVLAATPIGAELPPHCRTRGKATCPDRRHGSAPAHAISIVPAVCEPWAEETAETKTEWVCSGGSG